MPPKSNHETRGIIFSEIQYLPLTSLKIERGHFLQGVAVIYFTCWVAKITLAVIVIGVYSSEILRKREYSDNHLQGETRKLFGPQEGALAC